MTTHTSNVSVPGWTGAGYIIVNPQTGDGGYYISGGENGGFIDLNQIIYSIYAIADFLLNNLDEIGSFFWHNVIGTITNTLDNILDVFSVFDSCGTTQGLASLSILVMLLGLTSVLMSVAILSGGLFGLVYGIIISYLMAQLFNMVVNGMNRKCTG